jgi:hypothetical protein
VERAPGVVAAFTLRVSMPAEENYPEPRKLQSFPSGQLLFLGYKDYRDGKKKVMRLDGEELLRRFLLHVLPKGFVRIRHFGFLANRCRAQRLGQIRQAIAEHAQAPEPAGESADGGAPPSDEPRVCPRCRIGRLRVVGKLMACPRARAPTGG